MSARATQRRPASAQTLVLGFLAAVAVHILVVGTVEALRGPAAAVPSPLATGPLPGDAAGALELEALLESTCLGDAALTAAARSTTCLSPLGGELVTCLAEVKTAFAAERDRCRTSPDPITVEMTTMTPEQIARIDPEPLMEILEAAEQMKFEQQQQQQVAQMVQEEQKRQQEMMKRQAQVVETAKPTTEVAPDKARFLSEYDTKVQKETVARGSKNEEMIAKARPEELPTKPEARPDPSSSKPPTERPDGQNEEAPDLPGKLSMRSPGAIRPSQTPEEAKVRGRFDGSSLPSLDGLTAKRGDGSIDQQRREVDETRGGGGAGGGSPAIPDLKPSDDVLERALGGGSVDHLEAVEDGDETALNSKRWIGATFFNRLKRQVAQSWEPGEVWRRHDPSGSVYGFKSRVTQLRVSLDSRGKLVKAPTVVRPCGVDVLDEEAVRAFQAAAPFPNPPDGLAENGLITFEFSFHFEIGAPKTSWKILRGQ